MAFDGDTSGHPPLEQGFAGHDTARARHEFPQQIELLRGEWRLCAVHRATMACRVESNGAVFQRLLGVRIGESAA